MRRSANTIAAVAFLALAVGLLGSLPAPQAQSPAATSSPMRVYLPFVSRPFEPCPPKDGRWQGETITTQTPDEPRTITFRVSNNGKVINSGAAIGFYYRVSSGWFRCTGGTITLGWSVPIRGDCGFSTSGGLLHKVTWRGSFDSARTAQGTFEVSVFTTMCGTVKRQGTWRATWQGA